MMTAKSLKLPNAAMKSWDHGSDRSSFLSRVSKLLKPKSQKTVTASKANTRRMEVFENPLKNDDQSSVSSVFDNNTRRYSLETDSDITDSQAVVIDLHRQEEIETSLEDTESDTSSVDYDEQLRTFVNDSDFGSSDYSPRYWRKAATVRFNQPDAFQSSDSSSESDDATDEGITITNSRIVKSPIGADHVAYIENNGNVTEDSADKIAESIHKTVKDDLERKRLESMKKQKEGEKQSKNTPLKNLKKHEKETKNNEVQSTVVDISRDEEQKGPVKMGRRLKDFKVGIAAAFRILVASSDDYERQVVESKAGLVFGSETNEASSDETDDGPYFIRETTIRAGTVGKEEPDDGEKGANFQRKDRLVIEADNIASLDGLMSSSGNPSSPPAVGGYQNANMFSPKDSSNISYNNQTSITVAGDIGPDSKLPQVPNASGSEATDQNPNGQPAESDSQEPSNLTYASPINAHDISYNTKTNMVFGTVQVERDREDQTNNPATLPETPIDGPQAQGHKELAGWRKAVAGIGKSVISALGPNRPVEPNQLQVITTDQLLKRKVKIVPVFIPKGGTSNIKPGQYFISRNDMHSTQGTLPQIQAVLPQTNVQAQLLNPELVNRQHSQASLERVGSQMDQTAISH